MSKGKISLFTATMLNINVIVGAGILMTPPVMAGLAGNVSFLGWALCGLIFFPLVWCVAEASTLWAGEAGFYTFGKKGLGDTAGFISGWAHFVAYLAVPAAHVCGLRGLLATQFNFEFVAAHPFMFNAGYVLFLALLNLLSIKIVGMIQNTSTIVKLVPLLTVVLLFVFYLNPQFGFEFTTLPTLTATLPLTVFAFLGFEACCNISHRIEGGAKNASKALFYGFYATLILYVLFHFGLLQIMGADNLAQFGGAAFVQFLGFKSALIVAALKAIVSTAFVITYMSASYGIFLGNSSLLQGMAAEKTLPGSNYLMKTNKNDRPYVALACQAAGTFAISTLVQGFGALSSLVGISVLLAFVITIVALLKTKGKNIARKTYSLLGLASCSVLSYYSWLGLGNTLEMRISNITPFVIFMTLGIALYCIQTKCGKKRRA